MKQFNNLNSQIYKSSMDKLSSHMVLKVNYVFLMSLGKEKGMEWK